MEWDRKVLPHCSREPLEPPTPLLFPVRRTSLSLHCTTLPPKHNAGISGIEEEEEEEGALSRNDPKRSLCHIRNTGEVTLLADTTK